ncbi:hypothetical protein N658DRAFT_527694 [Parathielavia hyrcaniae]|uniref:Uncharacterized protein n=1 Tax=Parathielavia hyrcaniae TaxID=113614 RepID=A0AAN6PRC5_9PEZI|nr:hypothetical protein N658DRAFT_527694 [Parathielavia hyrcaniae]
MFLGKKNTKQGHAETQPTSRPLSHKRHQCWTPYPSSAAWFRTPSHFYHLHAITTSPSPPGLLPFITCHGVTNSHGLKWQITPLLRPSNNDDNSNNNNNTNLLLTHTYTLPIKLPLGSAATLSDTSTYSHQRIPLLPPLHNTYSFRVCPHATRHLRTLNLKVTKEAASIRVEHALRTVLGEEFVDEWRSDERGRQPRDVACGMCYTDSDLVFEPAVLQGEVRATVTVWKVLGGAAAGGGGSGLVAIGEKWEAAMGERAVKRPREDFGRVRRAFQKLVGGGENLLDGEINIEKAACGVRAGQMTGTGSVLEDIEPVEGVDVGQHVADGMQPPPPYAP